MPKAKPNFAAQMEELGDGMSEEEKAAAVAEERGEPAVQAVPEEPEEGAETQTAEPAEAAERARSRRPSPTTASRKWWKTATARGRSWSG